MNNNILNMYLSNEKIIVARVVAKIHFHFDPMIDFDDFKQDLRLRIIKASETADEATIIPKIKPWAIQIGRRLLCDIMRNHFGRYKYPKRSAFMGCDDITTFEKVTDIKEDLTTEEKKVLLGTLILKGKLTPKCKLTIQKYLKDDMLTHNERIMLHRGVQTIKQRLHI